MMTDSEQPVVSPNEFALFNDIANGQASRWTLADAALLASGVNDEHDRRYYLARCRQITAEAAVATANARSPQETADALVHFLSKTRMQGGFVSGQVDLRKLLETGEFNCVSAAILFDIVARPRGIDARPVIIPGHVFLRVGDLCVEPIKDRTCSAAAYQRTIDGQWEVANDVVADAFGNLRSYESTNLGLVGLVYYDEGERMSHNGNYGEAVVYELKALCLDANNPLFRRCLEDNFKNWFASSLESKDFARARNIAWIYAHLFGENTTAANMYRELASR